MPMFSEKAGEKSTFGPTMAIAAGLHRDKNKESKDGEDGEKKNLVTEHIAKAQEHLNKAKSAHEGKQHHEPDEDDASTSGAGSALEALGLHGKGE
jgi:single-stranded DNA-binding protein